MFLLLLFASLLTAASGSPTRAPGFDPTPVAIPSDSERSLRSSRPVSQLDLLTLRDLHGARISPDGKYVAFVVGQAVLARNSYRSGLFVVATQGASRPVCLGSAGPAHWDDDREWRNDDSPQWSSDSVYLYYRLNYSGSWQAWRWKRNGGKPVQVTHFAENVSAFQVSSDGTLLILDVEESMAGKKKDLGEHGILWDGSFRPGQPTSIVEQALKAAGTPTSIWIQDLRSGVAHKATPKEQAEHGKWISDVGEELWSRHKWRGHHITSAQISPNRSLVAYVRWIQDPTEAARRSFRLFLKPVNGGTPICLTLNAHSVEEYWWNADSKSIYYSEYAGDGRPRKLMQVAATGGVARQVLTLADLVTGYTHDATGQLLACIRENRMTPPQLALIDLSQGTIRTLVDLNPEFRQLRLSPAERIEVTNKYGDSFFGDLVLPPNREPGRRYPLVITTYRSNGSFLRGGSGDEYPIQIFAANGFAVLNFDVGVDHNVGPGDFSSAELQWASPVDGMRAAVEKLTEMGIIDPARVALTGHSHGSEMVGYAIGHTKLFHAAIASGPAGFDPLFFYLGQDIWQEIFNEWGLAGWPEGQSSRAWHNFSPALNATQIEAPLLINASDAEYFIGLQLITSLKSLHKPVELFIYADEPHIKVQPAHRIEICERNLDWLKFWLLDIEDNSPRKTSQYMRWRELRALKRVRSEN
jgi:dipeptidyl aminopeptidase/acylaminoacyl peptidase